MELPREYISYNQIRLYQDCPRRFYYHYIKEIKVPINEKTYVGVIFHKTIEEYFKRKIEGKVLSNENVKDLFSVFFDNEIRNSEVIWLTSIEKNKKRGFAFVNFFMKNIASNVSPLMVEKEISIYSPELDVKIMGIIDLIEKDFSITDFKTTTSKWSKSRVDKSYLQMMIYSYIIEKDLGFSPKELKFEILYSGKSNNIKHQRTVVVPTIVDENKMLSILKYIVNGIKSGNFYKNPSYLCNICEYRDICRKDKYL